MLRAFKAAGGIEITALFAGVALKCALRALPRLFTQHLQYSSALCTTRNASVGRHLQWPGPESILLARRLFARPLLRLLPAIHVSGLPVLPVRHKNLLLAFSPRK